MRIDASGLLAAARRAEQELERELPLAFSMAGDLIVNRARQTTLFRDRTGRLRGSILRGPVEGSFANGRLKINITVGARGVRYAASIHDGSRPHTIEASRRKALRFVAPGGGFAFAKRVRHPGTKARPFLDEAVEAERDAIGNVIGSSIRLAFARAGFEVSL